MIKENAYTFCLASWRMLLSHSLRSIFLLFFSLLLNLPRVDAQDEEEFYEIPVFLEVPRVGGTEISAVIKGEELYLPILELFDFLKIRAIPAPGLESVTGFFVNPEGTYTISRSENSITYQDKRVSLDPGDIIRTETNMYLRSKFFGEIFGLECNFSFRTLSVRLNSRLELPVIREMRQEEMRSNLRRLKGEMKADTVIPRSYPVLRFGMADWSAISTQEIGGRSDARLNLSLGSMLAGGEATAMLSYNSNEPFNEKRQHYLWRYVDNDFNIFRQAMVGKIATQSVSTIFYPVIGVQFTNTPTTYRRSFGTYTLAEHTDPGWVVELYVNNVLVDYVKADASGFYKFEIPLVYGNSIIQLKFYGPWGEERVREKNINIPFNFLPVKTFEYRASAGIVEDTAMSRFARLSMNYGVARKLTVGAGVEYLSSVASGPSMPFVNASWSVTNNLLLSGEFIWGVRSKGILSYRLPSNIQLELNYTKYDKDQRAIMYNYLEERKVSLSLPVRFNNFSSFNRFSLYQVVMPYAEYTTGEWTLSGSFSGINTNLTTIAILAGDADPYVYSNLSLAFRLPGKFIITPQAQYGFTGNEILSGKVRLEKRIFDKAFFNLSYEQNFKNNLKMTELGFRYNFSFAQTGATVRQSDRRTSFIEYARGSLIYDRHTKFLGADNQFNVSKGGISVIPYLDLNANGLRDKGEPKAYGLNLHANGGRTEKSENDTTIRILGLEPYTNVYIDLDENSFENIAWRLPVKVISVAVDPDILKHVEIPVTVVGEASGSVTLSAEAGKGLGRIIVSFFDDQRRLIGSMLTEDDGYYSKFGFVPGRYLVKIDTSQLRKLGMSADPAEREFIVKAGIEGDLISGLDFKLGLVTTTTGNDIPEIKPVAVKDTSYMIIHEISQELITITKDSWAIQLGAFRSKANADNMRKNLEKLLGRKLEIIIENGFYKVRINEIESREEVDRIIEILRKHGITELWIITLKARQQQIVLRQKEDTIMQVSEMKYLPVFGDDFYKLRSGKNELLEPVVLRIMEVLPPLANPRTGDLRLLGKPVEEEAPLVIVTPPQKIVNVIDVPVLAADITGSIVVLNLEPPKTEPVPAPDTLNVIDNKLNDQAKEKIIEPVIEVADLKKAEPEAQKVVEKEVTVVPPYAIQVAVFYKKSEALKAQRRISSKLDLPVQIIEQWEYFRVIIPGFFSREETFRFYPELAGLGYPGVSVIERK